MKRKIGKAWALGLIFSVHLGTGAALAQSPEFAYTQEKWALLRDNIIEYGELADLVHEYNPTVLSNRIAYDNDRGKTNNRLKNDYEDSANRLFDASDRMLEGTDEDQPNYASTYAGAVSTRIQAEQMQENADRENSDGTVKKMEYDRQEALLVQEAQGKMNQYWQKVYEIRGLESRLELARMKSRSVAVKRQAGLETQEGVLAAEKEAAEAQKAVLDAQAQADHLKRELAVMLGWSHEGEPEIREIPLIRRVDFAEMDLEKDQKKAQEENYLFQAGQRKRQFTSAAGGQRKQLDIQLEQAGQKIRADVENRWRLLAQAQEAQNQAQEELLMEQQKFQSASRRKDLGLIPQQEYQAAADALLQKECAESISALKLTQAREDYDWAIQGLADTGN